MDKTAHLALVRVVTFTDVRATVRNLSRTRRVAGYRAHCEGCGWRGKLWKDYRQAEREAHWHGYLENL